MKMVCKINQGRGWFGKLPLTVGKAYEVIDTVNIRFNEHRPFDYTGPVYKVVNDEGNVSCGIYYLAPFYLLRKSFR